LQDPVEFLFSRVRAASQHRSPSCLEATRTIARDSTHDVVKEMLATSAIKGDAGNRLNIGALIGSEWEVTEDAEVMEDADPAPGSTPTEEGKPDKWAQFQVPLPTRGEEFIGLERQVRGN